MHIEKRKLLADITMQEVVRNKDVVHYSTKDTEKADHSALEIFEQSANDHPGEFRVIEVTGFDTPLLLLTFVEFDEEEKILSPDENKGEE